MKTRTGSIVGLKELREHMETYIGRVHKGETITVFRRSKPIFNISPVDMWGDDGVWETVINFREIDKGGVPAEDVLKALRKVHGLHVQK